MAPPRYLVWIVVLAMLGGLVVVPTANAQSTGSPQITTVGPFEVDEGVVAVAALEAEDADTPADDLVWSKLGGDDAAAFTLSSAGVLAFVSAKDFESPDDADADAHYQVTVQVSDGADSDSADLVVVVGNVVELASAIAGPTAVSVAENSYGLVAAFSASSDADRDGVEWMITGSDADHFSMDSPAGTLRFALDPVSPNTSGVPPDFEVPVDADRDNVYEVTLQAVVGVDTTPTVDVAVTVTDVDEGGALTFGSTKPKVGTELTATLSDPDGVTDGTTSWRWERNDGREGWQMISGATSGSYTPTAADGDRFLRVTANYTDGFGAGKSAEAIVPNVVIAHRLSSLVITEHPSSRPMYPAFDPDTLHYAVGCTNMPLTLTMSTEMSATRLAVNGIRRAGPPAVVTVSDLDGGDERGDIPITLSGPEGGSTTYVVHCLRDDFPTITTTASTGATEQLILFSTPGRPDIRSAYLQVVDNRGVPRLRKSVFPRAVHLRTQEDGRYPYSYASLVGFVEVFRLGDLETWNFALLNHDFEVVKTVRNAFPVRQATNHDFLALEDGGFALLSYNPVRRDLSGFRDSMSNPYSTMEGTEDSIIQEIGTNGRERFRWNSWGHVAIEDCTQHRFPWDYAHINTIEDVDGDYLASLRGCSQVLLIDGDTGEVQWRLGKSNRSDADWMAVGGTPPSPIVGDPYGEFCGQHAATFLENGNLILFDNGGHCVVDPVTRESRRQGGVFSRVVEYSLDTHPVSGDLVRAVFQRHHSLHGDFDRYSLAQGHVEPMPNGDWLISWGRGTVDDDPATPLPPDEAITQVNPLTGEEVLSVVVTSAHDDSHVPVRGYLLSPVALARSHPPLEARIVKFPAFHSGSSDSPQVVVSFNRPVVDFDHQSSSLNVAGATVSSVRAHLVDGEPANAYLVTLTPDGDGPITFGLSSRQACDGSGICTADGTMLSEIPPNLTVAGPVTVSFQRAGYGVSEGGVTSVYVLLSGPHHGTGSVDVQVRVKTVTAQHDDLSVEPTDVVFEAGETRKTLIVSGLNDALVESGETAVLEFGDLPHSVSEGARNTATVTIADTDRAVFDFALGRSQVAEGGATQLLFSITNGVTYQESRQINLTLGGTATPNDDYSVAEQITLAGGAASVDTTITVVDDNLQEATAETVVIRATIGSDDTLIGTRTLTIPPSDVPDTALVTIDAGANIEEAEEAVFNLRRSGPTTQPLIVALEVTPHNARLAASPPRRFTFPSDEATGELRIRTGDDTLISDTSSVAVLILGSTSNPPGYLTDTNHRATVNVTDNDRAAFSVSPLSAELAENRSATLTVQPQGVIFARPQAITATLDGTAQEGVDYRLLNTDGRVQQSPVTLTLPARSRSTKMLVQALHDTEEDPPKTIDVTFTHNGRTIGQTTITLTEAPPPRPGRNLGGGGGNDDPPNGGAGDPPLSASERFSDIPAGQGLEEAVSWMILHDVTSGCAPELFCPQADLTRQQFVIFLWRAGGRPAAPYLGSEAFTDVRPGGYAEQSIGWAVANDITRGCTPGDYGTPNWRFCPQQPVTRGQMATLLYRHVQADYLGNIPSHSDIAPDDFYAVSVAWLTDFNVIPGCDPNLFCPNRPATRAEAAQFIHGIAIRPHIWGLGNTSLIPQ